MDIGIHLIAISKDHKRLYTQEGMIIESPEPLDIGELKIKLPEADPGQIVAVNKFGEIIGAYGGENEKQPS